MAIYTASMLRAETRQDVISEILTEGRTKTASARVRVFLSHSHWDKENTDYIRRARILLGMQGMDIWVDSDDRRLPVRTSPATAEGIKERIAEFGKMILLATPRSLASVWCSWEIGVADSMIERRNVVIWPIRDRIDSVIPGREFLGIYPHLETRKDGAPGVFAPGVTDRSVTLANWLRR